MNDYQVPGAPSRPGPQWPVYVVPPLLLVLLVWLTWPHMRYYVDSDALCYLNIAKQYVAGHYDHAINAYWSPMGCWLTAILAKLTGWELFTSAIIVNTVSVAGLMVSSQCLFNRFRDRPFERWCFGLMSAGFWLYALYFQSFTDFWQFLFQMLGLLLLLRDDFTEKVWIWLLLGVLGALAYFSKAYSFFFFPLMIFMAASVRLRVPGSFRWKRLVAICLVAGGVMLAFDAPWIYLLHEKYGIWTTSTAGKLNASWRIVGTQEFRQGIKTVVPPPYDGSLFYFEDPYRVQGRLVRFYDSPGTMLRQLARIGYNALGWVSVSNRISPFFFLTWLITLALLATRGWFRKLGPPMKILLLVYLVYPLPFWPFTFEGGRYVWFIMPAAAILFFVYAGEKLVPLLSPRIGKAFTAVFFLSFLVNPVLELKTMWGKGAAEHHMAQELKSLGIQGAFVSNRSYADASISLSQLSWFSQNAWYCQPLNTTSTRELLDDARRYGVHYYFYFYEGNGDDYQLRTADGRIQPDLSQDRIPGLKVFSLAP
ncbi:hypothetical protein [Taibaiella koreensis]|uniref:hypothetical protein n=1 Tax=Taibaiella koreensis TaxID=1268548 RepID=UPI000E59C265|nr:hypothetical protein [Taibaiella koreensis]